MFRDQLSAAVATAPRNDLARLSQTLWQAWGQGLVDDAQASELSAAIEARKAPAAPGGSARRHVGSRPISGASIARRRRIGSTGMMPPQIASRFTISEAAALTVILERVAQDGRCELSIGQIAGRAGTCATVVKNAVREARKLGLIAVETRRVAYDRNRTNVITIVSAELATWIRLRVRKVEQGGGVRFAPTTRQVDSFLPEPTRHAGWTDWNSRGGDRKVWANHQTSVEARGRRISR